MQSRILKYLIAEIILISVVFWYHPAYAYTEMGEVPAEWAVWSCWYWPWHNDYNPNLYDANEAMERYDDYDIGANAQSWEYNHHGPPTNPDSWWGHCHGWAAVACWERQPSTSKTVGGITFRVRDLKGLMIEAYHGCADGNSNELHKNDPSPGLFWRYLRHEIKGSNPMHGHGMAFVGELYYDPPGERTIWNYPIYKYKVSYSGSSTYSGTIKIWVANDNNPSYADSSDLHSRTFTYQFRGVKANGTDPVDSGTWIGSGPYHRPDYIWRPYPAITWTQYRENPELDESHLDNILSEDDAYEENNTQATAYDLSSKERTWLSSIADLGVQSDEDWYKIYVNSGYQRVQVDCRFIHYAGNINIELYDASGTRLAGSWSFTDNEFIEYRVPSGGTYYIRVYSYLNGYRGNTYNLWWDDLASS